MERSIDELIELLNDKDDFVVEDAVGELELRADEAVDPLIDALSHRKKQIRLNAATLLGAINNPKAIPALIETMHDNNKLVRSSNIAISNIVAILFGAAIKLISYISMWIDISDNT